MLNSIPQDELETPNRGNTSPNPPNSNRYNDNTNFVPAMKDPAPLATGQAGIGQIISGIFSQPAPIPQRDVKPVERVRHEGAYEKATPVDRAWAAIIRSIPVMGVCVLAGCAVYLVVGHGWVITLATILTACIVLAIFNTTEYRHSQAGVERHRAKLDHKLERDHEENRHVETMTAIENDYALKSRILDIAIAKITGRLSHD